MTMFQFLRQAAIALLLGFAAPTAQAEMAPAVGQCDMGSVQVVGDFGTVLFRVDLADEDAERAQGLMFVREMPRNVGMLFLWDQPGRRTFWMRNTYIPLDMIFIGPDGTIRHIHHNAVPLDETTIDGGQGVQAVLEINGGLARLYGMRVGDKVVHPALNDLASSVCG